MPIFNINKISSIKQGDNQISSVYCGNNLVWEKTEKIAYLGNRFVPLDAITIAFKNETNETLKANSEIISDYFSPYKIYMHNDNGNVEIFPEVDNVKIFANTYSDFLFDGCSKLTFIDFANFHTYNVSKMNYMFRNCTSLKSLDLSGFDTSNVYDMSYMFYNCTSLISLNVSSFDTFNVNDMNNMFTACSSLVSLDVSNFNTINVKYMNNMFNSCTSLKSLDLSSFDASNTLGMNAMFYKCISLVTLDLSNFKASNTLNMESMFSNCNLLVTIKGLPDFDTFSTTNMKYMFEKCYALVSTITIMNPSITQYNGMFSNCSTEASSEFIVNYADNETKVVAEKMVATKSVNSNVFLYKEPKAILLPGMDFNSKLFNHGFEYADGIVFAARGISSDKIATAEVVSTEDSPYKAYMYFDGSAICIRPEKSGVEIYANKDCNSMFDMYDTNRVLTYIDFENFNTSNTEIMCWMFSMGENLVALHLSELDISNVVDTNNMFYMCRKLYGNITIMNPNMSNYSSMFEGCSTDGGNFVVNYIDDATKIIAEAIVNEANPNIILGNQI